MNIAAHTFGRLKAAPEDLGAFVPQVVHGVFLECRSEWFKPQDRQTDVNWPIAEGPMPGFCGGVDRADLLGAGGRIAATYDFAHLQRLGSGASA